MAKGLDQNSSACSTRVNNQAAICVEYRSQTGKNGGEEEKLQS
jgi:hypothetical protein